MIAATLSTPISEVEAMPPEKALRYLAVAQRLIAARAGKR